MTDASPHQSVISQLAARLAESARGGRNFLSGMRKGLAMRDIVVLIIILVVGSWSAAQDQSNTKEIQAVVRKERWKGWGGGEPLPEALKAQEKPEKFTPYETPKGEKQKFSGKVEGVDQPTSAEVG